MHEEMIVAHSFFVEFIVLATFALPPVKPMSYKDQKLVKFH